jgi:hypothetical protein
MHFSKNLKAFVSNALTLLLGIQPPCREATFYLMGQEGREGLIPLSDSHPSSPPSWQSDYMGRDFPSPQNLCSFLDKRGGGMNPHNLCCFLQKGPGRGNTKATVD